MASNWGFQEGDSYNGPIWSISLEVVVYAIFFLTLAFVSRSWLVNAIILALCAFFRLFKFYHPIFDCLAFFYAGGLAAMAHRSVTKQSHRTLVTRAAWCVLVLTPLIIWAFHLSDGNRFPFYFLIGYTPVLLFCLCEDFKVGPKVRWCIEAAGNMTYSSYLLHFPIQLAVVIAFSEFETSIPFYGAGFLCLFITGTLVAAYFTYRYFELPAQSALRRRLG